MEYILIRSGFTDRDHGKLKEIAEHFVEKLKRELILNIRDRSSICKLCSFSVLINLLHSKNAIFSHIFYIILICYVYCEIYLYPNLIILILQKFLLYQINKADVRLNFYIKVHLIIYSTR